MEKVLELLGNQTQWFTFEQVHALANILDGKAYTKEEIQQKLQATIGPSLKYHHVPGYGFTIGEAQEVLKRVGDGYGWSYPQPTVEAKPSEKAYICYDKDDPDVQVKISATTRDEARRQFKALRQIDYFNCRCVRDDA